MITPTSPVEINTSAKKVLAQSGALGVQEMKAGLKSTCIKHRVWSVIRRGK